LTTGPRKALAGAVVEKLRGAMAEARLDVLLVMAPENIVYAAGVLPPSLRTVRTRLACSLIPAEGSTELIVVALEKRAVEPECWLDAVTPYREFEEDAVSVAAASLRKRGLSAASIGIEETYLPKAAFEVLQASLPNARFVAIDGLLAEARCIKTQDEIDSIASIGRAAQTIGEECLGLVSAGDTEKSLGTLISERYAETGGRLTMLVVGSGAR
jgi:Xaa-Pro aminopeptidase